MAVIVIFVEGAGTEPDPLPVYFLDNHDHATLICEGLKESEYRIFNFSIEHCTRSDRGRFAVWAEMTFDARDGVYGSIAAGIYDIIYRAHAIISGRRQREKPVSGLAEGSTPTETDSRSIEEIERTTPALDTQSIKWIASRKENQKKLGYPTNTLATYRLESSGGRRLSPYFGIDRDGRRWRRQSNKTEKSTVFYFAADVEKCQNKVSN